MIRQQRFVSLRCVVTATLIGVWIALLPGQMSAQQSGKGRTPLRARGFLENIGQWPASIRFGWSDGSLSASVDAQGDLTLYVSRRFEEGSGLVPVTKSEIEGSSSQAIEGKDRLATTYAFLKAQRTAWRVGVPAYDSVQQVEGETGARLQILSADANSLVLSMVVPPGQDLPSLRFASARGQHVEPNGRLTVETAAGTVTARLLEPAPDQGVRQPLLTRWVVRDPGTVGFDVPDWNGTSELTLTTGLEWSTYLGGSLGEIVSQAVIESSGTILVGGLTSSFDFPT